MSSRLKAHPDQLRIRGRYLEDGRPALQWDAGARVRPEVALEVVQYFTEPRYSILNSPLFAQSSGHRDPDPPLYLELEARNYNIATFDFSIYVVGGGFSRPKRLGYGRQYPGVLHSRYARLEHEGLDICCFWRRPCHKADVNLWFSLLSVPTCTKERMLALGERALSDRGLRGALNRLGFDEQSLRLTVKSKLPPHPDDLLRTRKSS